MAPNGEPVAGGVCLLEVIPSSVIVLEVGSNGASGGAVLAPGPNVAPVARNHLGHLLWLRDLVLVLVPAVTTTLFACNEHRRERVEVGQTLSVRGELDLDVLDNVGRVRVGLPQCVEVLLRLGGLRCLGQGARAEEVVDYACRQLPRGKARGGADCLLQPTIVRQEKGKTIVINLRGVYHALNGKRTRECGDLGINTPIPA